MKSRPVSLRFVFLILCFTSLHSKSTTLALYTESFPPYNFLQNETLTGINADIVLKACVLSNINCTTKMLPWRRAFSSALADANAGLFSVSRTPERESQFQWVGPLVYGNSCFYRLKDREDIQVNNSKSLLNYTVGIPRGDIYQKIFERLGMQEGKHYLTYSQKHEDTNMFKLRKLDLMLGSSLTLASQLSNVGLNVEDVVPVWTIDDPILKGNYLGLNKNVDPSIAVSLQSSIQRLKDNGQFAEAVQKYMGPPSTPNKLLPVALQRCINKEARY